MGVEKLKSGKYRYVFRRNGRKYQQGAFENRQLALEAETIYRRELQQIDAGTRQPSSTTWTFYQLVERFLQDRKPHLAPETYAYYQVHFSNMVKGLGDDFPIEVRTEIIAAPVSLDTGLC